MRAKVVVLAAHHVAACVLVGAAAILTTMRRSGEVHWVVGVALVAIASLAVTDVRRTKRQNAIGEAQQREVEAAERARRTVEHRFQTVFESHLVPLAIARDDGHVFEANDAWLRLVGRTRENLSRSEITCAAITPPEWHRQRAEMLECVQNHGRYGPAEKEYLCPDGRRVPVLVGATAMPGEPGTFLVFAVDLTEQKRNEDEARAAAQRAILLESERAARCAAERESRAKDEFVATLSHELRTPLNAILGFSQLAQRPGQTTEHQRQAFEVIERNARLLTQLIADLLDVSRIVSGKLRIELATVDLCAAIGAALATVRPAAEAKGVALVTAIHAEGAAVLGDAARLQQVVWNLVSNAIKFTPRGGRVEVSMAVTDGEARVEVGDTGLGIDQAFIPRLFERFCQAQGSATRRHGGLGLGLSIVKHLVELHGGTVHAASDGPGRGARFTVTLPLALADAQAKPTSRPLSAPCLAGARVLVVDDEPDARDLVQRLLEERGAAVVTAASAAEALDAIAAQRPDVMISDIGMPGVDGYDLIRRVRAGDAARDVPAVALTAYARPEDRERALSAGYQAHLRKPIEPQEMLTAVAGLVSGDPPARTS